MLRGILLGVGWGGLVAATAVTSVSLIYSNANRAPVMDAAQEVTSVAKPDVTVEPVTALEPAMEPAAAPAVEAPKAPAQVATEAQPTEEDANLPTDDTAQMETETPAMSASQEPPADSDAVTLDAPEAMTPPKADSEGTVAVTEEGAEAMGANDAPPSPATPSELADAPQPEAPPEGDEQTDVMTAPAMQNTPLEDDAEQVETQADEPDTPDVEVAALPQIITPDQSQTPQQDETLAVPSPAVPPVSQTPDETAPATDDQIETTRAPAPKITNLAPNVKTNRLPTIGGETAAEAVEVGQETTEETDERALSAHAMVFENPDAKPMFSVVLIDDPDFPITDDVLSHLPFALSFAIDAVRDDAYAVAARYRKAGFEVLMLTNLPFGANATDVEVAFGAYSRAIPQAIGVLDLGANGFLRGPSTATQIAGIMSEKGYGLITPSKGLNSAQKAAMREGVPAALVFRELDVDGEKPSVIRRYLDRAAFRAAQEGSVIMLGHTRPDTIEALVTWALEDRAASVAIAPVSAVLLAQ